MAQFLVPEAKHDCVRLQENSRTKAQFHPSCTQELKGQHRLLDSGPDKITATPHAIQHKCVTQFPTPAKGVTFDTGANARVSYLADMRSDLLVTTPAIRFKCNRNSAGRGSRAARCREHNCRQSETDKGRKHNGNSKGREQSVRDASSPSPRGTLGSDKKWR